MTIISLHSPVVLFLWSPTPSDLIIQFHTGITHPYTNATCKKDLYRQRLLGQLLPDLNFQQTRPGDQKQSPDAQV